MATPRVSSVRLTIAQLHILRTQMELEERRTVEREINNLIGTHSCDHLNIYHKMNLCVCRMTWPAGNEKQKQPNAFDNYHTDRLWVGFAYQCFCPLLSLSLAPCARCGGADAAVDSIFSHTRTHSLFHENEFIYISDNFFINFITSET